MRENERAKREKRKKEMRKKKKRTRILMIYTFLTDGRSVSNIITK